MALFKTDSLVLCYSDVEAAKQWWIDIFECRPEKVPEDWDNPLPSDIALKLPGHAQPTVLLNNRIEVAKAGFQRENDHPILFSNMLKNAREYLLGKGIAAEPIEDGRGTEFFEIHAVENNVIEICKEP